MKKLRSDREIIQAMCQTDSNLPMAIQALAEQRKMDVDNLTNYQLYLLIKLEAELAQNTGKNDYANKLVDLASRIDTDA